MHVIESRRNCQSAYTPCTVKLSLTYDTVKGMVGLPCQNRSGILCKGSACFELGLYHYRGQRHHLPNSLWVYALVFACGKKEKKKKKKASHGRLCGSTGGTPQLLTIIILILRERKTCL